MGTFSFSIEIGDPQGQRFEQIEALVGTNASYTVVPASMLQRLGVSPVERRPFSLADDRIVEREIAETTVRIDERVLTRIVVFGEGPNSVLGAETLEGFGLAVDPIGKRLIPVEGLLMEVATY